jgi:hypothetical protein
VWRHGLAGFLAAAAVGVLVAVGSAGRGGRGGGGASRGWVSSHAVTVREVLTAVNAVPVDPRAAGPAAMADACLPVERAGDAMLAAHPAPDARLTRAWTAVAHDVGIVARFCRDAAARGDTTMLEEVPNYFALTGATVEHLRVVMASYGPAM